MNECYSRTCDRKETFLFVTQRDINSQVEEEWKFSLKIVFRLVLVFVAQVKGIESYTFLVHIWDFGFHLWCVILSRNDYFVL